MYIFETHLHSFACGMDNATNVNGPLKHYSACTSKIPDSTYKHRSSDQIWVDMRWPVNVSGRLLNPPAWGQQAISTVPTSAAIVQSSLLFKTNNPPRFSLWLFLRKRNNECTEFGLMLLVPQVISGAWASSSPGAWRRNSAWGGIHHHNFTSWIMLFKAPNDKLSTLTYPNQVPELWRFTIQ